MADEAAVVEEGMSPLVAVTFQRNIHRKEKYLEAEPKALGITQIGLSVYTIVCLSVFLNNDLGHVGDDITFFISSLLVVIAGSTAVAAQNLHLPTLRACLGMQIVACVASIINTICTMIKMERIPSSCWHHYHINDTFYYGEVCHSIENTNSHFFAGDMLIQATLFAISATLTAYCCKVVNCCGPAPKMVNAACSKKHFECSVYAQQLTGDTQGSFKKAGYPEKIISGMDVVASDFFHKGKYDLDVKSPSGPSRHIMGKQLGDLYPSFIKNYPVQSTEVQFDQDDWSTGPR